MALTPPSSLRAVLEAALRPYAQILFSRRLGSGTLALAALATYPRAAIHSLLAVAVAHTLTLLMGFGVTTVREGLFACSAVLTTAALTTGADPVPFSLMLVGAALSVVFSAALSGLLQRVALPALSLPFVATAWVVTLTARLVPHPELAPATALAIIPHDWMSPSWLDIPAAVLFSHGALAGLLVILAVGWHSRIALLLGAVGAVAMTLVRIAFRAEVDVSALDLVASFNAILTAMALGGVWFVPHPSSIVLAFAGGATASIVAYALSPALAVLGVPVLSLPFAVTTILFISALRLRERDRHPVTAMLTATNPEDALERHLMRVRRFGDFAWLPFRLPFRGTWTVTQGHDGAHTHRGVWRHGIDFEIIGADGQAWEGEGRDPRDFRCYNLPILAAGTGTVESVRDGVPDNPIGGMNARENWGNTVVIAHGSELYSVYAHLKPGSIVVKAGDPVRAGTEIGRCGNSGRSLVPHLHFHVQRGPTLGSATVAADFGDVVTRTDDGSIVSHRVIPAEGAKVRPIMRDEALAEAMAFLPGSRWALTDEHSGRVEEAQVEVDLWGRRALRSPRGALYLESYDNALVTVAFDGDDDSLLRDLLLAMARIPFDQDARLAWSDRVPRRLLVAWPWTLLDLVTVVAPGLNDWEITYRARRQEGVLLVEGSSRDVRTTAALSLAGDGHRMSIVRRGVERRIFLAPSEPSTSPSTPGVSA